MRARHAPTTRAAQDPGNRDAAGLARIWWAKRGRGEKAAEYLVGRFQALKLEPLFDGGYRQIIPGEKPDTLIGRNVGVTCAGPTRRFEMNGSSWPRL